MPMAGSVAPWTSRGWLGPGVPETVTAGAPPAPPPSLECADHLPLCLTAQPPTRGGIGLSLTSLLPIEGQVLSLTPSAPRECDTQSSAFSAVLFGV